MLSFGSGSSSQVNSGKAMAECLEKSITGNSADVNILLIHSTVGHNFKELLRSASEICPRALVVGCTGSGVIYSEGVSEAMRALAVMTIHGPEANAVFRDGLTRENGRALAAEAADELRASLGDVNTIGVFTAGFDVTGDEIIAGIEDVFGPEIKLFGATAADNGKARGSFQFFGQTIAEHGLLLIGLADASLEMLWEAHHGSTPIGEPFEVTRSNWGHVIELDDAPAWPKLMERLGLPGDTSASETIPIAGLGIELPSVERETYDNSHVLRAPLQTDGEGGFYLPASAPVGTRLSLMRRDEEKIFAGTERMMERLVKKVGDREIVAVFHADCMARGRQTFDRVLKDEIITKMKYPLIGDEAVPWLGIYGFSEFCPLGEKNELHSYTSSVFPLVRRRNA